MEKTKLGESGMEKENIMTVKYKNKLKETEIKNIPLARIGGGMSFNNKKAMSDSAIVGKRKNFLRHPNGIIIGQMKQGHGIKPGRGI